MQGLWKSSIERAKLNIPRIENMGMVCSLGNRLYLNNSDWNYEQCIKDIINSFNEPHGTMAIFTDDYYFPAELVEMEKLAKQENDVFRFDGWFLVFSNLDYFMINLYKHHRSDKDITDEDAYNIFRCIANKLRQCDIRLDKRIGWTDDFYMYIADKEVLNQKKILVHDRYNLVTHIINKCKMIYEDVKLTSDGHIVCRINYNTVCKYDEMVEVAKDWLAKH